MASPITPEVAPCKCCTGTAGRFGVVDFNRHCEQSNPNALPVAGIPVYYHRCKTCGFLFTTAFDHFTHGDFAQFIYNDSYALVDVEYKEIRPKRNAEMLSRPLADHKNISILDFGGGNGVFEAELRRRGFTDVTTYDPFEPTKATPPNRTFDMVVSIEVFEHTPTPRQTMAMINSLLKPEGFLFFTTLLQPPEILAEKLNWWYVAPRNGHVSLHTPTSLKAILSPFKLQLGSFNPGVHAAWRTIPYFASKFFPK